MGWEAGHICGAKIERVLYNTTSDATLVAAPGAGKFIRVVGGVMASVGGSTSLESNTTAIMGPWVISAAPVVLDFNPIGWCDCAANEALNIELSATDGNVGTLFYVVLDE